MTATPCHNDLERLSPDQMRNANLITLLLLCAKTLQVTVPNCGRNHTPEGDEVAGKQLGSFVYQLTSMYGDGHSLESDILALAKQLGFTIEQRYLSKEAHA